MYLLLVAMLPAISLCFLFFLNSAPSQTFGQLVSFIIMSVIEVYHTWPLTIPKKLSPSNLPRLYFHDSPELSFQCVPLSELCCPTKESKRKYLHSSNRASS